MHQIIEFVAEILIVKFIAMDDKEDKNSKIPIMCTGQTFFQYWSDL